MKNTAATSSLSLMNPTRTIVTNFSTSQKDNGEHSESYDDGVWVLETCRNDSSSWIGCALSNNTIQVYDANRLQLIQSYHDNGTPKREKITTDLVTGRTENLLASSSSDGFISIFDIRQQAAALRFKISKDKEEEALSVDLGFGGTVAVVGSSRAKIHFFDLRGGSSNSNNNEKLLLGTYRDAHIEDVTRVRFRPDSSYLVSASEDGLACVFDVSKTSEESALQAVLNAQSPLRKAGFFGPSYEGVYCLTGSETLSVWHHDTAQRICDFGPNLRQDLTGLFAQQQQQVEIHYLVDCDWNTQNQQLSLLAGSHNGDGAVFRVDAGRITPLHTLHNGHRGDIRSCCHLNNNQHHNGVFATVGEDARLCEWNPQAQQGTSTVVQKNSSGSGPPARRRKTSSKTAKKSSPY
mmetsp:Transcript_22814/g.26003  ORF Transcript_22814/g.26003 Transcript_22814/m.26003 type:complete len:407 (-) Transcript_22814:9-1229(-)